jgi:hypothetical protein
MSTEYVTWGEDTFVVTTCAECGKPYSDKIGVAPDVSIGGELVTLPEPEWNCVCGNMNEMKYHSDDCPCTLGSQNLCELHDYFDGDHPDLEEELPEVDFVIPEIVRRMFDRIHGRKCA